MSVKSTTLANVPVLRPLLPAADRLLPYLRRIDDARVYSNWGPLTSEFEQRLEQALQLKQGCAVSASSGTAALVASILAVAGRATPQRRLAIMPSFTFVATAVAAEQCGYQPFLVDVDAGDWMLHPHELAKHAARNDVGVVIPVAPFGRAVPQAPWKSFRDRTDIPVVIDAAAGYEVLERDPSATLGEVPVCVSFHATKSFAIGEGGCVLSRDAQVVRKATRALNFGFVESRDSRSASINGKLSEYHAAVGLAEFDCWVQKKTAFAEVSTGLRQRFTAAGLAHRFVGAPDVASCYSLFVCADLGEADAIQRALAATGVDHRFWYGLGLHRQTHLREAARGPLPNTDALAPRIIGLPMAVDLSSDAMDRIVAAVKGGIADAG